MIRFKRWYDRAAMTPEELRLYNVWRSMKDRCFLKSCHCYADYGGRGITVHQSWIDDFAKFVTDVGLPPNPGMELDRWPNNDGNYEPGNTRWASRVENMLNVRTNRPVTINGVTKFASQWADEYGIKRSTFCCRMKWGKTGDDLLRRPRPKVRFVTINGITKRAVEWAKQIGIVNSAFLHRLEEGDTGDHLLRPSQRK